MRFSIGTDPEFFLKYKDRFVASQPYIGDRKNGTKYNSIKMNCGATVQRDNVAIEFATTPAYSLKSFQKFIDDARKDIKLMLPEGIEMVAIASVVFSRDQLEHPEALEFGCDPDYNAWTMTENHKPCAVNQDLRSAGAHIHVGHKSLLDPLNKIKMIRLMDCFLGLPFTVLDNSEASLRRRELYGKAGAYRPTPYGVEYRTLSNYWLSSNELTEFVYNSVGTALLNLYRDSDVYEWCSGNKNIQSVINEGKAKVAEKLYTKLIANSACHPNWFILNKLWRNLINVKKEKKEITNG